MNNNTKALRLLGGVPAPNRGHKRSRRYGKVGACGKSKVREEKIRAEIETANMNRKYEEKEAN
jgi:hypothetical protein